MKRILEPELMDNENQVIAWESSDRQTSVYNFSYWFNFLKVQNGTVLEVGCGNAIHLINLAKSYPSLNFIGIDGSQPMIDLANKKIKQEKLENRITVTCSKLEDYTSDIEFSAIISNGTLHHIPNQETFWTNICRINKNNCSVLVMDILRPNDEQDLDNFMKFVKDQNIYYQNDVYNSFKAAYTKDEIFNCLKQLKIAYQHYEGSSEKGSIIVVLLNTSLKL